MVLELLHGHTFSNQETVHRLLIELIDVLISAQDVSFQVYNKTDLHVQNNMFNISWQLKVY